MDLRKLSGLALLEATFWPAVAARDCSAEGLVDEDGVQVSSGLDARGRELPDPTPMQPPIGYSNGPSLADFVQRMIRNEVSRIASDNEFETFEEAEDFDIDDDPLDPLTPYESVFDPRYAPKPAAPLVAAAESPPAQPEPAASPAPSPGPPLGGA